MRAAFERPRLVGSPGAELGVSRSGGEIGIRLLVRDRFDRALDPHLATQRLPMEEERHARIVAELLALCALLVGEEDEACRTVALHKHHPDVRSAVGARRGQRHCIGVVGLAFTRHGEPFVEQLERIGPHRALALGLGLAQRQAIWSARDCYGMGAIWHSTSTNAWG